MKAITLPLDLGCQQCPLNGAAIVTPYMEPTVGKLGGVLFLAEAPGRHEDETSHQPLTGPSGQLVRDCIPDRYENLCSFDNICNCRPPDNRTPVRAEIDCCSPRRVKAIARIQPRLIIGLGAVPLKYLTGSSDITAMRGRLCVVQVGDHACHFLPTFHPSYVLRTAFDKYRPLASKFGQCMKQDIERGFALLGKLKSPQIPTEAELREKVFTFKADVPNIVRYINDATGAKGAVAIDIETSCLRPYSKDARILSIAISSEHETFAFLFDHPAHPRRQVELLEIKTALINLMGYHGLVAHNAPFELEWLIKYLGRDILIETPGWECTQLQAHILDERVGGQSLGDLARQHFGINHKTWFKLPKKDMASADIDEMLAYNAVDAKITLKLWHKQNELLKREGLLEVYREALPRQTTVAVMQSIGIDVDHNEAGRLQGKLSDEIDSILTSMSKLPAVQKFGNPAHGALPVFNPDSSKDVLTIFRDDLRISGIGKSADKAALEGIDHPLAKLIIDYRHKSKLKATYLDGLDIYPDGKLHTNFNTTFTETGRLSSDSPNLQNFPHRNDAWVREIVVPPKGHVIAAFDFSQLEACTAAMCSKDRVLVQALKDDYDIHLDLAEIVAQRCPQIYDGNIKAFRSLIKNKLTFPAIFGASAQSIAGYLGIDEAVSEGLLEEFWDTFHDLKAWQDRTMAFYYQHGYVESLTGRRRRYPLSRNQAINFPIQSVASDIVVKGMNTLSELALKELAWHLHPVLNIHDDLSFLLPEGEDLDANVKLIAEVMVNPGFDFVNVPLSVKCSLGYDWYHMEEIETFWSEDKQLTGVVA